MNKFEIIKAHNEIFQKAVETYGINVLIKPEVTFTTRSLRINGKCWRNGKRIDYNLQNANLIGSEFVNTISHEIAHWVQFRLYPSSKPHGTEFKRIHKALGGTGERCSSYGKTEDLYKEKIQEGKAFVYTCGCKKHFVSKVKHQNMQKKTKLGVDFYCKFCKGTVVYKQG